jgi:hypothetical protein
LRPHGRLEPPLRDLFDERLGSHLASRFQNLDLRHAAVFLDAEPDSRRTGLGVAGQRGDLAIDQAGALGVDVDSLAEVRYEISRFRQRDGELRRELAGHRDRASFGVPRGPEVPFTDRLHGHFVESESKRVSDPDPGRFALLADQDFHHHNALDSSSLSLFGIARIHAGNDLGDRLCERQQDVQHFTWFRG